MHNLLFISSISDKKFIIGSKHERITLMANKKLLKVGEIAKKANVTLRTVRYYDELGLIQPVERSSGSFRLYEDSTIAIIKLISNLKNLGFSLDEIKNLLLVADEDGDSNMITINRTKTILLEEQKKVQDKLALYKQLSEDIDKSLELIDNCIECRIAKNNEAPCKPGCINTSVHIKL